MVRVSLHGQMVKSMKVNILVIRNMDMVFIFGQMEENMRVNGLMESNMDWVFTLVLVESQR